MSKSGTVIVKLSDVSAFMPKLTVRVSSVPGKPNTFLLAIVHPNKTEAVLDPKTGEIIKNKRTGRIKKVGAVLHSEEVINLNSDQMEAFLEVKAMGDEMLSNGKFKSVETKFEEILHIPAARKGKMKLKTKNALAKGLEEDYADGSVDDEEVELLEDEVIDPDMEDNNEVVEEEDLVVVKVSKLAKKSKKTIKIIKKHLKAKVTKPKAFKNNNKNNKKIKVSKKTKKAKNKRNKNKQKR